MSENKSVDTYYFHNIRSCIVLLVIVLHAALGYCSFTSDWWLVVDHKNTLIADILVGCFDIFLMPVLFFISGYFTKSSYRKCTNIEFLVKKAKCLMVPWCIGMIFFNPFLLIMTYVSRKIPVESYSSLIVSYYKSVVAFPTSIIPESAFFFSHYHLWYLSLLFYFFVFYVVVRKITLLNPFMSSFTINQTEPDILIQFALLIAISSLGHAIFFSIFRDGWFVISIIHFQLSRIIPYLCFFMFGVVSSNRKWLQTHTYQSAPCILLCVTTLLTLGYLYISPVLLAKKIFLLTLVVSISRYTMCTLFLIAILGIAQKYFRRKTKFNTVIHEYSFHVYIIHLSLVTLLLFLFTKIEKLQVNIKLVLVSVLSMALSYGLAYCYRVLKTESRRNIR